jgi:hypothetical protein
MHLIVHLCRYWVGLHRCLKKKQACKLSRLGRLLFPYSILLGRTQSSRGFLSLNQTNAIRIAGNLSNIIVVSFSMPITRARKIRRPVAGWTCTVVVGNIHGRSSTFTIKRELIECYPVSQRPVVCAWYYDPHDVKATGIVQRSWMQQCGSLFLEPIPPPTLHGIWHIVPSAQCLLAIPAVPD